MDTTNSSNYDANMEQMTLNAATKRSASPPLFVEQKPETEQVEEIRLKPETMIEPKPETIIEPQLSMASNQLNRKSGISDGPSVQAQNERPPLAIYHQGFKTAERLTVKACKAFYREVAALRQEGYVNPEIDNICKTSLHRWHLPSARYPDVSPVALLGPAGVGKSSTINSILSKQGVAVETDSGPRGTYVVHEYLSAQLEQTECYRVCVPYLTETQYTTVISKHIRNITAHLRLDQDAELEEDEEREIERKHDTGIEFFKTLLCDREEFRTSDDICEYFKDQLNEHDDLNELHPDLKCFIEEYLASRQLKERNTEVYSAESEAELIEVYRKVSSPPRVTANRDPRPFPWPLITKVRIHHDNDLLNCGVTLADAPGMTDLNQAVVENTDTCIKQAGSILVFADIQRIEAATGVLDNNLRKCIRLGKMDKTYLVVPKVDGKVNFSEDERKGLSEKDQGLLNSAGELLKELRCELSQAEHDKDTAVEFEQLKALDRLCRDLQPKVASAEAAIKQANVRIHCRAMEEQLVGKFRQLTKSERAPDLQVHFISNHEYQKHLKGYDVKSPPHLDLQATGIPALRRILYDIPARGKLNTLSRIIKNRLPSIFNGVNGVLTKEFIERKETVQQVIKDVMIGYTDLVKRTIQEIIARFQEHVQDFIDSHQRPWKQKAEKLLVGWQKYNHMTLKAFCRKSGYWRVRKGEAYISWNATITEIFSEQLARSFDELDQGLANIKVNTGTNIRELFGKLESRLEACEDFQGVENMVPFFKYICGVKDNAMKDAADLFGELEGAIHLIRAAATIAEDNEDSYTAVAMQETYEACLAMKADNYERIGDGKRRRNHKKAGAQLRRINRIKSRFTGTAEQENLFTSISKAAAKEFDKAVWDWDGKLTMQLAEASSEVLNDFDRRFVEPGVKTEENPEAKQRLKDAAKRAMEVIEGEASTNLAAAKAYEEDGLKTLADM